ncbi:hypothetical protein niasHT_027640 [Heterodera trifolii]|uniref:Uncharacterized protein n=1 Tax=Heterodera trifolii TaxID=157864 RepID=A0ABD2K5T3_9BILA
MGFAYLKTVHGVLSCVQFLFLSLALIVGFFLWSSDSHELNWLFFSANRPLISLVLVALVVLWWLNLFILCQQLFVRDLLEQLGKVKLLFVHGIALLFLLFSALIESYYLSKVSDGDYYLPRLIIVMILCWLLLLSQIGQFIFVFCQ